jgi:hypothetical protein
VKGLVMIGFHAVQQPSFERVGEPMQQKRERVGRTVLSEAAVLFQQPGHSQFFSKTSLVARQLRESHMAELFECKSVRSTRCYKE